MGDGAEYMENAVTVTVAITPKLPQPTGMARLARIVIPGVPSNHAG